MDREEADKVREMGDGVIQEAYEWMEELEKVRVKEILILD